MAIVSDGLYNAVPSTSPTVGEASWNLQGLLLSYLRRVTALSVLPMRVRAYAPSPEPLTLRTQIVDCSNKNYFEKGGWTISYYPETNMWGSFHSYVPYLYFNTSTDFYSLSEIISIFKN